MVVKREVTGHVAMPFGKLDTAAEVELVILPDSNHRRHDLNCLGKLFDALRQPPGFGRVLAQLLIQPITVHDVKMHLICPVPIEDFVGGCAMSHTVERILVGA